MYAPKLSANSSFLTPAVFADRNEAARALLESQIRLMTYLAEGGDLSDIIRITDELRLAIAKFQATPEAEIQNDTKSDLVNNINTAVNYLETLEKIRSNEALIVEWLAVSDRVELDHTDRRIERDLGLLIDQRFDILVINDSEYPLAEQRLKSRNYQRLILLSKVEAALDKVRDNSDELMTAILAVTSGDTIAPNQVAFVGFSDDKFKQKVVQAISDRIQERFMTRATVGRFLKRWFLQLISNIPQLVESGIARQGIEGVGKNSSALVVGSGPSLDEVSDYIKNLAEKPIIICALSATKALFRAGITPDFVVVLDPQQPVSHLDGIDTSLVGAFYVEFSMNPELIKAIKTRIIPFGAGKDVHSLTHRLGIPGLPFFQTGGSVIHPAVDLAVRLGCKDIGFVGMDLGFVNDRIYASNTVDGHLFQMTADGKQYTKAQINEIGEAGPTVMAEGNDGTFLHTSIPLNQYRLWLEDAIKLYQENDTSIKFSNFSLRGAKIVGADYELISEHDFSVDPMLNLRDVVSSAPKAIEWARIPEIIKRLNVAIKNIEKVKKSCSKALKDSSNVKLVAQVSKDVSRCDELTMILAADLIEVQEMILRASINHGQKLYELLQKTAVACDEVLSAYKTLLIGLRQ